MLDEAHRLEKRMKKKKNKEKDRIVKKEVVDKIKKEGKENKMKEEHIKKTKKKKVKEDDKINKPESEPFVNVDGDEDDEQCSAKHCLQPTGDDISWVQCDKCQKWYHLLCIGMTQEPADDEEFICRPCIKRQRQSAAAKARHAAQRAEARRSSGAATPTPPTTPQDIQIKMEPIDMMPEQAAPQPVEDEVADVNPQTKDKMNLVVDENQKVDPDEPCPPNDPTPCTKEQPEITAMETDLATDSTREPTPTSTIAASDQVVPAAEQTLESEDVQEAVAPMDTSEEIISVVSTPVANSPEAAQDEAMDVQEPEVRSPMDRTLETKTSESMPLQHNSETLVDKSTTPPQALSPELGTLQDKPIMTSSEPGESQLESTSPVHLAR